jgi:hypothetical protein
VCDPSAIVGFGKARIEPDRLGKIGYSAVVVPLGLVPVPLVVVGHGICPLLVLFPLCLEHGEPLALGPFDCSLLLRLLLGLEFALALGLLGCSLLVGLLLGLEYALALGPLSCSLLLGFLLLGSGSRRSTLALLLPFDLLAPV